jgi:rubrerythrin
MVEPDGGVVDNWRMEILLYVLAAAAAAACVFVLARLVRRETAGKSVHLRQLLRAGVEAEREGVAFYARFGRMSEDPAVKELCVKLARDEAEHRKVLEKALSRWRSIPVDEAAESALKEDMRRRGIFATPPVDTTEREMLGFAIDLEEKLAEFYASFEGEFPETWKKMRIGRLVADEKAHADALRALKER